MAAASPTLAAPDAGPSPGVWRLAWRRLRDDRAAMWALGIVAAFTLLVLASAVGLVAADWQREVGVPFANPVFLGATADESIRIERPDGPRLDLSAVDPLAPQYAQWDARAALIQQHVVPHRATLPFGGDRLGRDVVAKAIKGAQVSILIGVFAALLAAAIGTLFGAVAGYFGGIAGDVLEWLYNVFTAVPGILLIFAFAAVLGRGTSTVVLILALTGWTAVYRQVRAEYLKHRVREYVRAAEAIGASHGSRMFVHILPNVSHVVLVQVSLLVVFFIKSEVILSFLGLGVPIDSVSWGTMLNEAQSELILGKWWQLAAATALMAVFVTAFSVLTDALRDALDPRLR
ncbi:MAG TPA: ABC transporter permease [Burkholderiaceae bacterium]|nr:ABC transporter permease [Burkholderiaceae bacterium]